MGRHLPDIESLELLLLVSNLGSLGRAAAELGISQPAASVRIRSMERQIGFPVLIRSPNGSTLTEQGRLLAEWGREVLAAARTLSAGIAALRADRHGQLRVAASQTVAEVLLPGWLATFTARVPDVEISLRSTNSATVERALLDRTAHLGFVEAPQSSRDLTGIRIAQDELVVIVPPAHPWVRRRRGITAAELAGTRLVRREAGSGTRAALDAALDRAAPEVPRPAPLLELSTSSAVRAAVVAGTGPAVVSSLAMNDDLAAGRLCLIRVLDMEIRRELRAVWLAADRPSGPAADLLAIARRSSGN